MSDENKGGVGPEGGGFDEDVAFDDFESKSGGGIGDALRDNPLVKIGIVLGGFATVVVGIMLFGGKKEQTPTSVMRGGSGVTEAPGTEQVSEVYRKAVEESNVQAVEKALKEGGSALPVPLAPPVGRVNLAEEVKEAEDPLERWRRIQDERARRESKEKPALPQQDPNAAVISDLASAMSTQMSSILQSIEIKPPRYMSVAEADYLDQKAKEAAIAAATQALVEDKQEVIEIILPAGEVEYAQLLTEANSDIQGPILAQIVSGPLAGSRLLGNFSVKEDEYLVLSFNTVVIDGISHSVDAIAVDPKTTHTGLVTDTDKRYFKRVILPAAAAFVEGFGAAIAQTGSTTVSNNSTVTQQSEDLDAKQEVFKGVEEAAGKVGEILDDEASKTKPLVKVASGTPMGILFLQPVTEEPDSH